MFYISYLKFFYNFIIIIFLGKIQVLTAQENQHLEYLGTASYKQDKQIKTLRLTDQTVGFSENSFTATNTYIYL